MNNDHTKYYTKMFKNKQNKREVQGALTNVMSVDNEKLNLIQYDDGVGKKVSDVGMNLRSQSILDQDQANIDKLN
jgi:hypothetical protein